MSCCPFWLTALGVCADHPPQMHQKDKTMLDAPRGMITPQLGKAPRAGLCTDCGVSRMTDDRACGRACQFIAPDYEAVEARIHGRSADPGRGEEAFFGVTQAMYRARLSLPATGAQWTGITTALAESLLRAGAIDAVITVAPDPSDKWRPVPVLVTDPEALAQCRGMRMGFAPSVALLEDAQKRGFRRLAFIGIPCQTYALRALEQEFGFARLYVIGTPCSDNTTTARFHEFLALLDDAPEQISYLEFRADYTVELRFSDGRKPRFIPFLQLPISQLPADFFPMTCKTCVDYTNRLADITVGYMGGDGAQWLLVRNARGAEMLAGIMDHVTVTPLTDKGNRKAAVAGFLANTERAAGGLPLRRMPNWLRPVVAFLQPRIGPRGLEFARARVEMKAIETILHLRRSHPAKIKNMVPAHVWRVAAKYGLIPDSSEIARKDRAP